MLKLFIYQHRTNIAVKQSMYILCFSLLHVKILKIQHGLIHCLMQESWIYCFMRTFSFNACTLYIHMPRYFLQSNKNLLSYAGILVLIKVCALSI